MSYNLAAGLSGTYPFDYCQIGHVGLLVNGYDANKILDLRRGTLADLGLATPAAPTQVPAGGALTGAFSWRVRWADAITGTVSLGGAILTATLAAQTPTLTQPAGAPARATHWLLERTTNGGREYYPVNTSDASPYGSVLGATYVDANSDSTIRQRDGEAYDDVQGVPGRASICWANGLVGFMAGAIIYKFTGSINNGSPTLTGAGFSVDMEGGFASFDADVDGKQYLLKTFVNATTFTLGENYAGTNKVTQPARLAGRRDRYRWCEPNEPESWGSDEVGGLSNETFLGDDGEPIVGGIGLGPAGSLICKETRMFLHSYREHPSMAPIGDGRILTLQARRGLCGREFIYRVGNQVFGGDVFGVWTLEPGGEPEDISGPIQNDWKALDFSQKDKFFIYHDATRRELYFCVIDSTADSYPKAAFVWDLERREWVGTKSNRHAGKTCGVEVPDGQGALRPLFYTQVVGGASSYGWFDNIGRSLGAPPSATPLVGTASAGTATTATVTAGNFPTTGEKLKGVPMTLLRAADGSQETSVITDNTGTVLTFNALVGAAPVNGDTIIVGSISASWLTGRQDAGDPTRKKRWKRAYLWLLNDAAAHDLKVRAYFDGSSTPSSDIGVSLTEDGVALTAATAGITVSPSAQKSRYYVTLGHKLAVDVELEFYSIKSGQPWQILAVELEFDPEESKDARK